MGKLLKYKLYKMSAVEIYNLVLEGSIEKFPKGFWQQERAKEYAIECLKYLIEEKLKLSDKEIKEQICQNFFIKYKLKGMINKCFNNSPYFAFNSAYPNRFQQWEFKQVKQGYWSDKNNGIKATKWLIETKLNLTKKEIREQVSFKLFKENGLSGMLTTCFNNSPFDAINETYPGEFQEWELCTTPIGFWNDKNNGIKATKWLVETKLKLNEQQLKEQLSCNLFKRYGLNGMLQVCFNNSPYQAISETYPERNYQPWDFKSTPQRYWVSKENAIKSIKYLIEERLKLTDEELKEQLSTKLFEDNGLKGMLNCWFKNSPYRAIDNTYPGKFKKSDFKNYR